jgi:hypothetical protein
MAAARDFVDLDDVKELAYHLYLIAEQKGWGGDRAAVQRPGDVVDGPGGRVAEDHRPGPGAGPASVRRRVGEGRVRDGVEQPGPDRPGHGAAGEGLAPFVDAAMSAATPTGRDWVEVPQSRDSTRHGTDHRYSPEDARFLLKVITEEWRVFKDKLSRAR